MHQANAIVLLTLERPETELSSLGSRPPSSTASLRLSSRERAPGQPSRAIEGSPRASVCSVNDEVVHGIPSKKRAVAEGDIVSLDFGGVVDGYFGDNALTAGVGSISNELQKLLEVTEQAMYQGHRGDGAGQSRLGHRIRRSDASSSATASPWSAISLDTGSAARFTRIRRSRTTFRPGGIPGSARGCASPSSRW